MAFAFGGFELVAEFAAGIEEDFESEFAQFARQFLGIVEHFRRKEGHVENCRSTFCVWQIVFVCEFGKDALEAERAAANGTIHA